jgi:hypothetical protein
MWDEKARNTLYPSFRIPLPPSLTSEKSEAINTGALFSSLLTFLQIAAKFRITEPMIHMAKMWTVAHLCAFKDPEATTIYHVTSLMTFSFTKQFRNFPKCDRFQMESINGIGEPEFRYNREIATKTLPRRTRLKLRKQQCFQHLPSAIFSRMALHFSLLGSRSFIRKSLGFQYVGIFIRA